MENDFMPRWIVHCIALVGLRKTTERFPDIYDVTGVREYK